MLVKAKYLKLIKLIKLIKYILKIFNRIFFHLIQNLQNPLINEKLNNDIKMNLADFI